MLPDWDWGINAEIYVQNNQFPNGNSNRVSPEITLAQGSDEGVVSLHQENELWRCAALEPGDATLIVSYGGKTVQIDIEVKNEVYEIELRTKNNTSTRDVAGGSIQLEAVGKLYRYNRPDANVDPDEFTFGWEKSDPNEIVGSFDPNKNEATVTFKSEEQLGEIKEGEVTVSAEMKAKDAGSTVVAEDEIYLELEDEVWNIRVENGEIDENLCVGDSQQVWLEHIYIDEGEGDNPVKERKQVSPVVSVPEDFSLALECDPEGVAEVSGPDRSGKFTVTRKGMSEADGELTLVRQPDGSNSEPEELDNVEFFLNEISGTNLRDYWIYSDDLPIDEDKGHCVYLDEGDTINPTVQVENEGFTLPSEKYEIVVERERDNDDVWLPDNLPLTHGAAGPNRYRLTAKAKANSGFTGETEDCIEVEVMSKTCLTPHGPEVAFTDGDNKEGPNPMRDYYRVVKGGSLSALAVTIDGVPISQDNYEVRYSKETKDNARDGIPGFGLENEGTAFNSGSTDFPNETGYYSCLIKGTGTPGAGYYGINGIVCVYVASSAAELAELEAADALMKALWDLDFDDLDSNEVKRIRAAYNKLSQVAKDNLPEYFLERLSAAEVIAQINALNLNNPSADAVAKARKAYNALNNWLKEEIPDDVLNKLIAAEKKVKEEADKAAAAAKARAAAQAAEDARQGIYDPTIPKVKAKKPAAKKAKITAKWTKLKKKQLKKSKATNYEIWVCPNTGFAKGDTIERIVGKGKASIKIGGLQKNTKYFVKVRAIKYVNGKKYVGPWNQKSVKTKKK